MCVSNVVKNRAKHFSSKCIFSFIPCVTLEVMMEDGILLRLCVMHISTAGESLWKGIPIKITLFSFVSSHWDAVQM